MKVRLIARVDGIAWERTVERPYSRAPAPDEWVYLGETDDGTGLMATPVAVVLWENDGIVSLRCDMQGSGETAEQLLAGLGFTRRDIEQT